MRILIFTLLVIFSNFTLQAQQKLMGVANLLQDPNVGQLGSIYTMNEDGTNFLVEASFFPAGSMPEFPPIYSNDGFLYGVTRNGLGGISYGTAYRSRLDGSEYKLLYYFPFDGSSYLGTHPSSQLIEDGSGYVYGTTADGGNYNMGVIFKLAKDGSSYTVIRHFNEGYPSQLLMGSDGMIYGKTAQGFVNMLFKINTNGSNYTILKVFLSDPFASPPVVQLLGPEPLVQLSSGRLAGLTTAQGGYPGGLFTIDTNGNNFDSLQFSVDGTNGIATSGFLLKGSDGYLYASLESGGTNYQGTLLRINGTATGYQKILDFSGTMGIGPSRLQESGSKLYGGTKSGGYQNYGLVFEVNTDGSNFTPVFAPGYLSGPADGGFTKGPGGMLIGVTAGSGSGRLYQFTPSGSSGNIFSFGGYPLGSGPEGRLTLVNDSSDVVGVCASGGEYGSGTIFKFHRGATGPQKLFDFDGFASGGQPMRGILVGSDGRYYGVTRSGGTNGAGLLYRINSDGSQFTVLMQFGDLGGNFTNQDRGLPIELPSGKLVGVNFDGGVGYGVAYRIDKDGTNFSILHNFNLDSAAYPVQSPILASDGKLYGVTAQGGTNNSGVLYKMNIDGTGFSVIHSFDQIADFTVSPSEQLTEGKGGYLYGIADGANGGSIHGTVFKINKNGSGYTPLQHFISPTDPWDFRSKISLGNDSTMYAYSVNTGPGNQGGGNVFTIGSNGGFQILKHFGNGSPPVYGEILPLPEPVITQDQTITFSEIPDFTLGAPPFVLSATASSGLPVTFTINSDSVATISGDSLHIVSVGSATVTAHQAGNANFNPAPDVQRTFSVSSPQPIITSFTPASGPVGTSVTIIGTGFSATLANNIVIFGATAATVTAATDTLLTVTVPTGATYAPITVLKTTTGLLAYTQSNFTPTFSPNKGTIGGADFSPKVDFTTGSNPYFVSIGDLDGDGKADLAVVNIANSSVSVFRNTSSAGSISYAAKVDFATGPNPYSVSLGDLDGDGKADMAVANSSPIVSVFRNTGIVGTISYAAKIDFTTGSSPRSVSIGDLNGDGKADMAVANLSSNTVSVFLNTGSTGAINYAAKVDFATGANPYSVSIGDLDGDGKADLAVANYGSNTVSGFLNTGSAAAINYAPKVDFATGANPQSVFVGDLDGDGKADLSVANYGSSTVSVFRNTGSAGTISYAAKVDFATGANPLSVSIGDLDGDGKADLAVANTSSNTVSVFRNTGSAGTISYAAKVDFITGNQPRSVSIGDLDGDGKADLAIANQNSNTVSVIRNNPLPPPPTITSFTPTSGPVGTAVTITGTGFSATPVNNIVIFGATAATVTAATDTLLTVNVPTGATYAPVTVLNTTTGLLAYTQSNFTPTFSPSKGTITAVDFSPKVDFTTGSNPYSVSLGDLDGDGKADLAVVNIGSSTVSVFRNTSSAGSISYAAKVDFATGPNPHSVSLGDLDGDGKADMAVANSSPTVSVFRNTGSVGTISYAAKIDFTTGISPWAVSIGDLNGDGKADLAIPNYSSNTVSVLLNTGSAGAINYAAKVDFTTGDQPISTSIGDLDGDGKADLAVANQGSNAVSVFRNTGSAGDISYAAKVDFTTGTNPYSVSIGDLDGDGKADLAVANLGSATVSVLHNTGSAGTISYAAKVDFTSGTQPYSVSIGDLDGDGKADLAVANLGSATVSIFHNTGSVGAISYAAKVDFTTGSFPRSVSIGDLDGDGKADLAVANYNSNTVSVIRNNPLPPPPTITSFTPASGPVGTSVIIIGTGFSATLANNIVIFGATAATVTAATDTLLTVTVPTGATYAPITVLNTTSGLLAYTQSNFTPTFFPNKGSITPNDFSPKVDFATGTSPRSISIGDLDGDGKADLAVANQNSNTVSVFLNTSSADTISYAPKVDFTTEQFPLSIFLGDLDGDGKLDMAVTNGSSFSVSVFRNTSSAGTVSFAPKVDFVTATGPQSISIGDLNGDGKADMAVANGGSGSVSVFRNSSSVGTISFAPKLDFTTGTGPQSVSIGDLDGDSKADIAVANGSSNTVSVFRNTSSTETISFAAKVDFTTDSFPISVSIGDLDGDGKSDLALANASSNSVSVFRNTGSPGTITYAAKVDLTTGTSPHSVSIGDLDGDGKADLAVANRASGTVSIFRNTGSAGTISYAAKVDFTTGTQPFSVSIGDLDGDGKSDMAVSNISSSTISIIRNKPVFPPTITTFTPNSGPVSTSVIITGTGFNTTPANNIVIFGATAATVTAATATQLTVTVPIGATYAPITVLNTTTGLLANTQSNFTPTFSPNKGAITAADFSPKVDFTTGTNPQSVSIGDLDGDGKADLVVANFDSNTVSVFRNTGSTGAISYAAKVDFTTGSFPQSVSIGDLDGDGKADLVVANFDSNTLSIFRNTGSGGTISFAAKVDFMTGLIPYSVSIGDLNGDGKADLAVANYLSNTLSIFRNTGSGGTISFAAKVDFTTGTNPRSVSIGDLDGDGKADLAVANYNSNTVSIFRNTSSAGIISFAAKVDFATGSNPYSVSQGDLDGDGKTDLAVANYLSNTLSIFRNTGSPGTISYAAKMDFVTGTNPISVSVGDLDGDGKADLAVANSSSNTISVFRNTGSVGTISYAAKVDFATGGNPRSVSIGDLDGDGKADLAVANQNSNTVSVIRNNPLPPPPTITSFTPASGPVGTSVTIIGTGFSATLANNIVIFGATAATVTAATDTLLMVTMPTGATYAPITVLNTTTGLLAYSQSNFTPTFSPSKGSITVADFSPKVDFATGTGPYSVSIGDLDRDGKADLAVTNLSSNTVSVFRNTGSADTISYAAKVDFTTGTGPFSVSIGDLDGDGKADLAVANSSGNTISVFRNTGSAGTISYAAKVDFTTGSTPRSVSIADQDGDGKADLAVANLGSNTVSVFRNTGSAGAISFAAKVDFATGSNPIAISTGDLDGDGKADLAVTNFGSSTVSVFRNTSSVGTISYAAKVDFTTGPSPYFVSMGDLDGDGKSDLALANANNSTVSVFRNTGSPGTISYSAKVDFTTGSFPISVSLGDLDGDGKADLAVANNLSNTVSVFRNTGSAGTISYAAKVDFTTGTQPFSVSIGDLDGDGRADLAVGNVISNTVSVIRNNPVFPPTITSFTPTSAPADSVVTITGTNFSGATAVSFGGTAAASFNIQSPTTITAVVGTGATGSINVTTPGGADSLAGFSFIQYQTITFDSLPASTFGDSLLMLFATASSGLPVAYASSNPAVATVSGDTLTIVGAGTTIITASQAGNANYNAAADVPQTLTVNQATQTITFNPLPSKQLGDAPFQLSASASSGLPISYFSSNPLVATISGDTVTIVGVGIIDITATQAGDTNFLPADSVTQQFVVNDFVERPTIPSSAIVFSNTFSTQLDVAFTPGNGKRHLVVARASTSISWTPLDSVGYKANSNFSSSTDLGDGTRVILADSLATVHVTGLNPATTYFFRVYEYNGDSVNAEYLVSGAPTASKATLALPNVNVTAPANGATGINVTVTVTSRSLAGATTYTLQLSNVPDFSAGVIEKSGSRSQSFSGLAFDTLYYARVKTNLSPDFGAVTSFRTGSAESFAYVVTPANNATGVITNSGTLTVVSNLVIGAVLYTIELNTNSTFTGISKLKSGPRTLSFTGLSAGTTYYSRVRTNFTPTTWGVTRQFTTGVVSYVSSPGNGATNVSYQPTVSASDVGATSYTIELSPSNLFDVGLISNTSTSRTMSFTGLQFNTLYYSRVQTDLVPGYGPIKTFTTNSPLYYSYVTSPANGASNVNYITNITANTVPGAVNYTIEANPDSNFGPSTAIALSSTSRTISFSLGYNTLYYVRVQTDALPGQWGAIKSFTTKGPLAFSYITSPVNGASNVNYVTNITANTVPGAGSYWIEANPDPNFGSTTAIVRTGVGRTYSFSLAYNTLYHVRVQTNLVPDEWGPERTFTTGDPVSLAYVTSPANGATGVPTTVTVGANILSGASMYTIELNLESDFTGTAIIKSGARTQSFVGLQEGRTYYSRVYTNLAPLQWGATRSFSTVNPGGRVAGDYQAVDDEVSDFSSQVELSGFPNPFKDQLTVLVQTDLQIPIKFQLFDMSGRTIRQSDEMTNRPIRVDTDFAPGVYLIRIEGENITKTMKVMKN